jgi:CRP-like cAMP-binding protein
MDLDSYDTHLVYKKQMLYSEGKRPKYLYYLKSGQIKTYQTNDDGKEYITNLYAPGDFIGYVPLLEEKNYEDSADALKDSEVAIIPREEFVQLVYNDINIATKFIKLITANMKEKETRLLNLAYDSLRKRIAKALIDIHSKFNKNNVGQTIDISRDDIAHYVGTATESLIRTLSDFKSEGLIEIKGGKISIVNAAKLGDLLY